MSQFEVSLDGTSHGPGITAKIEACPAGIQIDEAFVAQELARRRPGQALTTPRQETDDFEITRGLAPSGETTGDTLEIFIPNRGQQSQSYDKLHNVLRPGHGSALQMLKDPDFEQAGGGKASARLTTGTVAAGAIAHLAMNQQIAAHQPETQAWVIQIGHLMADPDIQPTEAAIYDSPVRCPDEAASSHMENLLAQLIEQGESVGGLVRCQTSDYPGTIGERPGVSLDGRLAGALMTVNAVKSVTIGDLEVASRYGSDYIDEIKDYEGTTLYTFTNHAGGILGGLSVGGAPVITHISFKPTGSTRQPVRTVDLNHQPRRIELGAEDRHDPCVAIRGVEVVKAVQRIVLYQAWLNEQSNRT